VRGIFRHECIGIAQIFQTQKDQNGPRQERIPIDGRSTLMTLSNLCQRRLGQSLKLLGKDQYGLDFVHGDSMVGVRGESAM